MLSLFEQALNKETGLTLARCGKRDGPDHAHDCLFTANHLHWDLIDRLRSDQAPQAATVHVLTLGHHKGRLPYVKAQIAQEANALNKDVSVERCWRNLGLADNSCDDEETECLHPTLFAMDPNVQRLLDALRQHGYRARVRTIRTTSANQVFSSEARRVVLEQEFLKAGARIKYELCPHLPENQWPLGYDYFKVPGFGSLVVTYRNCPNNCPLALWAGDPWFPLFPRKTNAEAARAVELVNQGDDEISVDDIPF